MSEQIAAGDLQQIEQDTQPCSLVCTSKLFDNLLERWRRSNEEAVTSMTKQNTVSESGEALNHCHDATNKYMGRCIADQSVIGIVSRQRRNYLQGTTKQTVPTQDLSIQTICHSPDCSTSRETSLGMQDRLLKYNKHSSSQNNNESKYCSNPNDLAPNDNNEMPCRRQLYLDDFAIHNASDNAASENFTESLDSTDQPVSLKDNLEHKEGHHFISTEQFNNNLMEFVSEITPIKNHKTKTCHHEVLELLNKEKNKIVDEISRCSPTIKQTAPQNCLNLASLKVLSSSPTCDIITLKDSPKKKSYINPEHFFKTQENMPSTKNNTRMIKGNRPFKYKIEHNLKYNDKPHAGSSFNKLPEFDKTQTISDNIEASCSWRNPPLRMITNYPDREIRPCESNIKRRSINNTDGIDRELPDPMKNEVDIDKLIKDMCGKLSTGNMSKLRKRSLQHEQEKQQIETYNNDTEMLPSFDKNWETYSDQGNFDRILHTGNNSSNISQIKGDGSDKNTEIYKPTFCDKQNLQFDDSCLEFNVPTLNMNTKACENVVYDQETLQFEGTDLINDAQSEKPSSDVSNKIFEPKKQQSKVEKDDLISINSKKIPTVTDYARSLQNYIKNQRRIENHTHVENQKHVENQIHFETQKHVENQKHMETEKHVETQKLVENQKHVETQKHIENKTHVETQKDVENQKHVENQQHIENQPVVENQEPAVEPEVEENIHVCEWIKYATASPIQKRLFKFKDLKICRICKTTQSPTVIIPEMPYFSHPGYFNQVPFYPLNLPITNSYNFYNNIGYGYMQHCPEINQQFIPRDGQYVFTATAIPQKINVLENTEQSGRETVEHPAVGSKTVQNKACTKTLNSNIVLDNSSELQSKNGNNYQFFKDENSNLIITKPNLPDVTSNEVLQQATFYLPDKNEMEKNLACRDQKLNLESGFLTKGENLNNIASYIHDIKQNSSKSNLDVSVTESVPSVTSVKNEDIVKNINLNMNLSPVCLKKEDNVLNMIVSSADKIALREADEANLNYSLLNEASERSGLIIVKKEMQSPAVIVSEKADGCIEINIHSSQNIANTKKQILNCLSTISFSENKSENLSAQSVNMNVFPHETEMVQKENVNLHKLDNTSVCSTSEEKAVTVITYKRNDTEISGKITCNSNLGETQIKALVTGLTNLISGTTSEE